MARGDNNLEAAKIAAFNELKLAERAQIDATERFAAAQERYRTLTMPSLIELAEKQGYFQVHPETQRAMLKFTSASETVNVTEVGPVAQPSSDASVEVAVDFAHNVGSEKRSILLTHGITWMGKGMGWRGKVTEYGMQALVSAFGDRLKRITEMASENPRQDADVSASLESSASAPGESLQGYDQATARKDVHDIQGTQDKSEAAPSSDGGAEAEVKEPIGKNTDQTREISRYPKPRPLFSRQYNR